MTANAEIVLEEHADTLVIPEAAITYDAAKNASVDVADPTADTGRRRLPVKLGIGNGTKTEVLEGLRQGERVVLPG
jgi:HlyD family secretion protein